MKKILAMLLALVMVLGLAACGGGNDNNKAPDADKPADATPDDGAANDAPAEPALDPVTLRVWFHGSTVSPEASAKVMESVNAYLQDKINVTLEPIWGTWGDFDTATVTALTGGDDVDIYFTCNWSSNEYNSYARDGYWVKLDDMLPTYGADLLTTIPDGIWECAKTNGYDGMGVYAVPALKDTATQNCWDLNGTLLAELGYNVDEFVEFASMNPDFYYSDEFEEALQKAKDAKGGDFYPLVGEPVVFERIATGTAIITGDLNGAPVLSYYYDVEHPATDIGSKIVCKYATPEFKKFAERTYYLSQKGFISPQTQNVDTANNYREACASTGDYLISSQSYAFGCELDYSRARGIDVRMIPTDAPYMDATSGQGAMMAISATSKNPERALMFLNLLNTDPELMTMLNYGTEGYTYNKNADGTISFIDEVRATYSPWTNGMGNVRQLPPTAEQGVDFWERFSAYYDSAEVLPYGSFILDTSELSNEATALANVYGQYGFQLMGGATNPDTVLPEFLAKLEEAGIQKLLDAANDQLSAFLAG
ncbi:MAG: ABC transporter substrate-binding protein [Oscillospiraceae bacterium]|nr:ABC transporter substrate-binding protein [Oscillospiraceae bacterium]